MYRLLSSASATIDRGRLPSERPTQTFVLRRIRAGLEKQTRRYSYLPFDAVPRPLWHGLGLTDYGFVHTKV